MPGGSSHKAGTGWWRTGRAPSCVDQVISMSILSFSHIPTGLAAYDVELIEGPLWITLLGSLSFESASC